jgi:hypothetical protein
MPKLHIMSHCGKDWLVGIDGRDITDAKTSGGMFAGTPFMAIGNEILINAPKVKSPMPCKVCGHPVELKVVGE